ncbi:MAG: DUF2182 domain-containing protein [Acidobacteriota bacterium]|nr:DUF2182 domain-containing protein [Acidobacteriota bacterium]
MAAPGEVPASRWWIDRSGRTVAYVVLIVAAAAWVVMLELPGAMMPGMGGAATGMAAPAPVAAMHSMMGNSGAGFSLAGMAVFTAAWTVMMAAMMLPSATPMIALCGTVARRRGPDRSVRAVVAFALSYVVLWALTGIPVYAAALGIDALERSHRWAAGLAPYTVAATLLAAGAYQFSALKRTCLANCRNPLSFLAAHWRPGLTGAARAGLLHARSCLGCCAPLMVVLVAAGGMGLAWVLLIAAAVALEKLASGWRSPSALTGLGLLGVGSSLVIDPGLAGLLRG